MLGQKLSFDGFAMARSIFIQLYDSHFKPELVCQDF